MTCPRHVRRYSFRSAMLRDVLYSNLPFERRKRVHEAAPHRPPVQPCHGVSSRPRLRAGDGARDRRRGRSRRRKGGGVSVGAEALQDGRELGAGDAPCCGRGRAGMPRLYLYLGCISAAPRLHFGCTSYLAPGSYRVLGGGSVPLTSPRPLSAGALVRVLGGGRFGDDAGQHWI